MSGTTVVAVLDEDGMIEIDAANGQTDRWQTEKKTLLIFVITPIVLIATNTKVI